MNHEEATNYLNDLGDRVPDRRPPIGEIVHAGKQAERRKSRSIFTSIAAAAAVLVAGGTWTAQQWTAGDNEAVDPHAANPPTTPALPVETPGSSERPCPPAPASRPGVDRSTVPAPDDAEGLTVNASGTAAAWFEPTSGPLPFLVVYDVASGREVAREDLGIGEDLRSSSLRMDDTALYYQSSSDASVWLRYRWGIDDYPSVFVLCAD